MLSRREASAPYPWRVCAAILVVASRPLETCATYPLGGVHMRVCMRGVLRARRLGGWGVCLPGLCGRGSRGEAGAHGVKVCVDRGFCLG